MVLTINIYAKKYIYKTWTREERSQPAVTLGNLIVKKKMIKIKNISKLKIA